LNSEWNIDISLCVMWSCCKGLTRKPKTYPPLATVLKITKVGPNLDVLIVIYEKFIHTLYNFSSHKFLLLLKILGCIMYVYIHNMSLNKYLLK